MNGIVSRYGGSIASLFSIYGLLEQTVKNKGSHRVGRSEGTRFRYRITWVGGWSDRSCC